MKAVWCAVVVAMLWQGCAASGPTLGSMGAIPAPASDQGRLYFYRVYSVFGSGMRPGIFVDGVEVGQSVPGGVFYVDVAPGEHEITVPVEVYPGANLRRVTMSPGQTRYFRTWVGGGGFAGRTNIAEEIEATALPDVRSLSYTGGAD